MWYLHHCSSGYSSCIICVALFCTDAVAGAFETKWSLTRVDRRDERLTRNHEAQGEEKKRKHEQRRVDMQVKASDQICPRTWESSEDVKGLFMVHLASGHREGERARGINWVTYVARVIRQEEEVEEEGDGRNGSQADLQRVTVQCIKRETNKYGILSINCPIWCNDNWTISTGPCKVQETFYWTPWKLYPAFRVDTQMDPKWPSAADQITL